MEWIMERVCAAHVGSGLLLVLNKNRFYHSKELFESCQILNVYKLNRRFHAHNKKQNLHHSLKKMINLLICIQYAFQVGITGNHKLYQAHVDFEFPLGVQQYGTN